MKIRIQKQSAQQGTVMMVTLMVAGIIGATLASYLLMTQNQNVSIYRSQTWNSSMAVTEAGLEDGLQLINRFAGSFDSIEKWTNYTTSDNWDASGSVYHIQRTNIQGNPATCAYDIYITNNGGFLGPTLTAVATVPWNFQFTASAPPQTMFAAVGAPSQNLSLGRSVAMSTKKDSLFTVAMAALGSIDLKGNNLRTDSFDSGDANYNINGLYPAGNINMTKAGGDVCTDSMLTDSLNIGNANIKGTVRTGPGVNTMEIGANGTVGDRAWVEGGSLGIQPGHSATDFNVIFPNVVLPDGLVSPSTKPANTQTVNGTNYTYVFTNSGDWRITTSGSIYVGTNANVRLKIGFNYSLGSGSIIRIASEGATLQIFETGTFTVSGQGWIDNTSGHPERFYLFGLPSCTSISFGGNGSFYGCVYAPQAAFGLGGGGSDTWDFVGSSVTKTVQMNGHYNFHFDENLRRIGPSRGYIPTSWKEVATH